jgi:hypothetical protein
MATERFPSQLRKLDQRFGGREGWETNRSWTRNSHVV